MPVQVSLRDNLYFIDSQGILDWPDQMTKLKLAALKGVTRVFHCWINLICEFVLQLSIEEFGLNIKLIHELIWGSKFFS